MSDPKPPPTTPPDDEPKPPPTTPPDDEKLEFVDVHDPQYGVIAFLLGQQKRIDDGDETTDA